MIFLKKINVSLIKTTLDLKKEDAEEGGEMKVSKVFAKSFPRALIHLDQCSSPVSNWFQGHVEDQMNCSKLH